jgi:ferredoxin
LIDAMPALSRTEQLLKDIAAPISILVERKSVADRPSKQPQNIPGAWYVDTTCTPCRVCLKEASNLLRYNEDETAVYFFKQPETQEETASAQRAMEVCPSLAIGNDG